MDEISNFTSRLLADRNVTELELFLERSTLCDGPFMSLDVKLDQLCYTMTADVYVTDKKILLQRGDLIDFKLTFPREPNTSITVDLVVLP